MEGGKSFRGTRVGRRMKEKKELQQLQNFVSQLALECTNDQSTSTSKQQNLIDSQKLSSLKSSSLNSSLETNNNIAEKQNTSLLLNPNQQSEKNNITPHENGKEFLTVVRSDSTVVRSEDESSKSKYQSYRSVRAGKVAKQKDQAR